MQKKYLDSAKTVLIYISVVIYICFILSKQRKKTTNRRFNNFSLSFIGCIGEKRENIIKNKKDNRKMSQEKYNQESALGELRSWAPGVKNRIECIYKENKKSHRVFGSLEEMLELAKTKKEANLFFVPQEVEYPEKRFITQKDVKRWKNLIIDLDPVRPAGTVSLQEELDAACTVAHKIYDQVIYPYFKTGLIFLSGNGYHVWHQLTWK